MGSDVLEFTVCSSAVVCGCSGCLPMSTHTGAVQCNLMLVVGPAGSSCSRLCTIGFLNVPKDECSAVILLLLFHV